MIESKKAQAELKAILDRVEETLHGIEGLLGLLGGTAMKIPDYVRLANYSTKEENVVGVRLPLLDEIEFEVREYSTLAKPFWVDTLVDYLQDALEAVQQKYSRDFPSAVTVITGPSRTADIEKTLVLGAHGPKELVIFVEQK